MSKKRGGSVRGAGSKTKGTDAPASALNAGASEPAKPNGAQATGKGNGKLPPGPIADAPTAPPVRTPRSKTGPAGRATREHAAQEAADKAAALDDLLHDSRTLVPGERAGTPPTPALSTETQDKGKRTGRGAKRGRAKDKARGKPGRGEKGGGEAGASRDSGKLGVDVAILWRGDMLTARFFSKPQIITIGPEGTFTMPGDVVGGSAQVLVEPHRSSGFGLRIDNPKAGGHLIVDGDVHDLPEVRGGKVPGLKGPVVPLTAATRAVLLYDDFTFIVSRLPVPPPRKFSFFSRDMLPILLSFFMAALLTIGPITAAYSIADLRGRSKLSYKEKLDRRIAQLEFIEVKKEEPPPESDEKKEEKKEEPPPLKAKEKEKKEEEQVKKEASKLEKDLNKLDEEERKEKIVAMVEEQAKAATADVDKALADMNNQLMGTRLFQEADEGEGDTANPAEGAGGDVLADPEGLTAGKVLAVKSGAASDTMGGKAATQRAQIDGLGKDKNAGKNVDIAIKKRTQKVVRVGGGRGSKSRGELPKKVIKRYIATKMGAIKACYQKGLQANPGLQGKVKVKFLIQPTGAVGGVKISDSSLNSPAVESCLLRNIKTWRFPRAKGGGSTMVIYPFNFRNR